MKQILKLFILIMCISAMAHATHYKVFLQGGQSNSDGRAPGAGLPTSPVDLQAAQTDVMLYHGNAYGNAYLAADTWIELAPGSGSQNASTVQFGPEVTFGRSMADFSPSDNFAIIKYARGGSKLATDWNVQSGAQYSIFLTKVNNALNDLINAGHTYEIVGMIWMQGESDSTSAYANSYQSNLNSLITDIRSRFGDNLPFVIGETWRNEGDSSHPGTLGDIVSTAQSTVANSNPYNGFVTTRSFTWQDEYHLDAEGQINLGYGMASEMKRILNADISEYTLSITDNGVPAVEISSSTGHGGVGNYAVSVASGTLVTLTAPAFSGGYSFSSWSGDINDTSRTITFTMDKLISLTLNYEISDVDLPNVIAHWSFDTDYSDVSGNGIDGTLEDVGTTGNCGIITEEGSYVFGGGALDLSDDKDIVTFAAQNLLSDSDGWAVTFWAKDRNAVTDQGGMVIGDYTNSSDFIWIDNKFGGVRSRTNSSTYTADFAVGSEDTSWHHYAFVAEGADISLYFDGVFFDTKENEAGTDFDINAIGNAYNSTHYNYDFDGQIDEVWIFDQAINADFVTRLYEINDIELKIAFYPEPSNGSQPIAIDLSDNLIPGELSWGAPQAYSDATYDIYFGITEPNLAIAAPYGLTKLNSSAQSDTSIAPSSFLPLDYNQTYYWVVDSYEPGAEPVLHQGLAWQFTTSVEDTSPVVVAGSSYLTWIDELPLAIDAAVNDNSEGDIASISWNVISGPGIAIAEDMQMIDRPDFIDNIDGDPNLLRDWIGTDSRGADDASSDVLTLTLSGLPAGIYSWKSYHHDPEYQADMFDVIVNDSNGSAKTPGVLQSSEDSVPATFTTTIVSDGSDISLVFIGSDDEHGMFTLNGFELTGNGDPLMIDFSRNRTAPDTPFIMSGYHGYLADHEVPDSFTTQSFSAFGTSVSVTPSWSAPGLSVTSSNSSLLAPAAVVELANAPEVVGTYTVEITASDAAGQSDSATLELVVYSDACAAALSKGITLNYYDVDDNCVVDIYDFAVFVAYWLEDLRASDSIPY